MTTSIRAAHVTVVLLLLMTVVSSADESGNDNCFSIVVGKGASADGHVLVAHNEDSGPLQVVVNHQKVPRRKHDTAEKVTLLNGGEVDQPQETWEYIWSEIPGLRFSDSYLNEWGVTICSDACPSRGAGALGARRSPAGRGTDRTVRLRRFGTNVYHCRPD